MKKIVFFSMSLLLTGTGGVWAQGSKGSKVEIKICDKGVTTCVKGSKVGSKLKKGAQLGACTAKRGNQDETNPAFKAFAAYPVPFDQNTTLYFTPEISGMHSLMVYNITGKLVATLFEATAEADKAYSVTFGGPETPPGIYICKLITTTGSRTLKIIKMD